MIEKLFRSRYTAKVFVTGVVILFAYGLRLLKAFEPIWIALLAVFFGGIFGAGLWKVISNRFVKIPPDFALIVRYEFSDGGGPVIRRVARGSRESLERLQRLLPVIPPHEGSRVNTSAEMTVIAWDVWECNEYENYE